MQGGTDICSGAICAGFSLVYGTVDHLCNFIITIPDKDTPYSIFAGYLAGRIAG
jgi:hypothetical protein